MAHLVQIKKVQFRLESYLELSYSDFPLFYKVDTFKKTCQSLEKYNWRNRKKVIALDDGGKIHIMRNCPHQRVGEFGRLGKKFNC